MGKGETRVVAVVKLDKGFYGRWRVIPYDPDPLSILSRPKAPSSTPSTKSQQ